MLEMTCPVLIHLYWLLHGLVRDNSLKPPRTWTKAIMFGYVLKGLGGIGQRLPPLLSELVRWHLF